MLLTHARSVCTASILVKRRAQRSTSTRRAALLNAGRSALTRSANAHVLCRVRHASNRARGKHLLLAVSCSVLFFLFDERL